MKQTFYTLALYSIGLLSALWHSTSLAINQGIYINQQTAENKVYLNHLITQSKKAGIDTFVIDLHRINGKYKKNVVLVKQNGLKHVARIVVFPEGGSRLQVQSKGYWKKKFKLVKHAINLGADEIQLDYIRYTSKQRPSTQNAKDIQKVIDWFREELKPYNKPLQIAVFGQTSFHEVKTIGQSIPLFANSVDVICPMVYPSHYEPYMVHAKQPYKTVYSSLMSIHQQFEKPIAFRLNPYIELFNYRYPMNREQKLDYIRAQIKAAKDAKADGWYAWSANNYYNNLFYVLTQ